MHPARKILIPFSLLYGGITRLRNKLYEYGIFESQSFDLPVICVGNLSLGGTGKSPMVEYLVSLLKERKKVATLSRGYKRRSKGFYLLKGNENATETGDEPLQFKIKFPEAMVAVDEKRVRGIENLLLQQEKPELIILDDAFQHRKVKAGLNILITAFGNLYAEDIVLPAGNLREPVEGAQRAQVIVVTKCPADLPEAEQTVLKKKISPKPGQQVFFSKIVYPEFITGLKHQLPLKELQKKKFSLVTGIANPDPLVKFLKKKELHFKHSKFADHHNFTSSELKMLNEQEIILTTEKDFVRLKNKIAQEKLFYLPIKMGFLNNQKKFDALIGNFIETETSGE